MTYDQFWNDRPELYYDYEDAHLDELKEKDTLNWQLATYIAIGINSPKDFPNKPMYWAKEEESNMTLQDKIMAMVENVNQQFK